MKYNTDHGALAHCSSSVSFDDRVFIDPLVAVEYLTDKQRDWERLGIDRAKVCNACEKWRPEGGRPMPPRPKAPNPCGRYGSCNGCYLSYLDPVDESEREHKDDLYTRWAAAKAAVDDAEQGIRRDGNGQIVYTSEARTTNDHQAAEVQLKRARAELALIEETMSRRGMRVGHSLKRWNSVRVERYDGKRREA